MISKGETSPVAAARNTSVILLSGLILSRNMMGRRSKGRGGLLQGLEVDLGRKGLQSNKTALNL